MKCPYCKSEIHEKKEKKELERHENDMAYVHKQMKKKMGKK